MADDRMIEKMSDGAIDYLIKCWLSSNGLGKVGKPERGKLIAGIKNVIANMVYAQTASIIRADGLDFRQKELQEWQLYNFGVSFIEDMILGMTEELGEMAHWILKRKQGIREGANGGDFKEEIADAFADVVIYGIQAMTSEGIDATEAFRSTVKKVLERDWKNNPQGIGESQHKQKEGEKA